ncbi:hypothetical protein LSAT2_018379 [Lamellibrachia satsuma]|nr:hypothetical protein LSAT2_018379 [Lamellibrachia satsuma]
MKNTWKQTYSLHCRDHCAECEKKIPDSQNESETYLGSSSVPVETTLLPYPTLMPLEVTSTIVDKTLYALTVV